MITRFYLLFLLCPLTVFPAQKIQLPEENVVVTAHADPVPFENLSRTVTVFTHDDIAALPVHSVSEVLAQALSADVESRSPFGVQSDIKLRGSAYSQVLVMVDGIRLNDSQTGHHNADFPVQLQDIDRVEVLLGSGSSLYGADPVGGIVNIITRRKDKGARASVSGGENGFAAGSFSAGFQKGKYHQSISASGNRASGFQYDRDFRTVSVSGRSDFGDKTSIFVSHVNKEFGANGFYGPAPSREWTNQTLISFERTYALKSGIKGLIQSSYRTHGDRFLYNQTMPGLYENRHRTHAIELLVKAQIPITDMGSVTFGSEAGGDWIHSSNLGNHDFRRVSVFSELSWNLNKKAALYPGLRFDHYANFGSAVNPSISGSWWVLPRLRLRSSAGRAFRIPTFTELYYKDPNNQADSLLKPERSWSVEAGGDIIPAENWLGSFAYFSRSERNVIDWIRFSPSEKWRTSNIRKLHTEGFEIGLERSMGAQAHVRMHYSYISTDAGNVPYISKYVLDYARHTWASSTNFPLFFDLKYRQTLSYKKRSNGQDYWILNNALERAFYKLVASVDFSNLLDSRYQEVRGVDMPGRWMIFTLRTK
jgi:outer membrane cobalamin receptor